jgi:integrase
LRAADVQQIEGCWTINLTPEAGTMKTGIARRVPLHSHLIGQGFLEFVRHRGDGPLFYRPRKQPQSDDLMKRKKSPASQARQRLAKWVREIGITDRQLLPNHAWRHTFKLIADRVEISPKMSDFITGHTPASEGSKYGAPSLTDMAKAIEKFPRYEIPPRALEAKT